MNEVTSNDTFARIEVVPGDRAIFQGDHMRTYQCPICWRAIFSQYEGDEIPRVECPNAAFGAHRLLWIRRR